MLQIPIFIGRFQPPSKRHQQIIDDILKKYGSINIVVVEGEKTKTLPQNFLTFEDRKMLLKQLFPSQNVNIILGKTGFIPDIVDQNKLLKHPSDRVIVVAGSDRVDSYKKQFKNVPYSFNVIEIPRLDDNEISSTKIREALNNNDFDNYSKLVATGLNNKEHFINLKQLYQKTKQKPLIEKSFAMYIKTVPHKNDILNLLNEFDINKLFKSGKKVKELKILTEGGNLTLDSGHEAHRIDLKKVDRSQLQKVVIEALKDFNDKFKSDYGYPLWPNIDNLIKERHIFSGSSRSLFNKDITDKQFAKFKPIVGDLDLQYPQQHSSILFDFIQKYTNKNFGRTKLLGSGGKSILQHNTLFMLPDSLNNYNLQIDFEPVEFDKETNQPTEFAKFGYYSSWHDIQSNVKGTFRDYIWRSLVAVNRLDNVILVNRKTGEIINKSIILNQFTFSNARGLRYKFKPFLDKYNHPLIINGKNAIVEIPSKEATYHQSLDTVFTIVFKRIPSEQEIKNMHSFIKTLEMMKLYLDPQKIDVVFEGFVHTLWDPKYAVKLERDNPENDKKYKMAAYNEFIKVFPYLHTKYESLTKSLQMQFYEKYIKKT